MLRTAFANRAKKQLCEGPTAPTPDDEELGARSLSDEDFCRFSPDDLRPHCGPPVVWNRARNQF